MKDPRTVHGIGTCQHVCPDLVIGIYIITDGVPQLGKYLTFVKKTRFVTVQQQCDIYVRHAEITFLIRWIGELNGTFAE